MTYPTIIETQTLIGTVMVCASNVTTLNSLLVPSLSLPTGSDQPRGAAGRGGPAAMEILRR